jgi:hypothetical protein
MVHRNRSKARTVVEERSHSRSVEMFTEYEPGSYVSFVSLPPLPMVVALDGVLTVADLALEAYERALEPKRLVSIPHSDQERKHVKSRECYLRCSSIRG